MTDNQRDLEAGAIAAEPAYGEDEHEDNEQRVRAAKRVESGDGKFIVRGSDGIYQALLDAGAVSEPAHFVRRCVIDLEVGHVARIYIERFAERATLKEALLEAGLAEFPEEVEG